jgi:transposase-like protein
MSLNMVVLPQANNAIDAKTQSVKKTFIRDYSYNAYLPNLKKQISDMAMNGSGIRDTARVLNISPNTVIETLKKSPRSPIDQ